LFDNAGYNMIILIWEYKTAKMVGVMRKLFDQYKTGVFVIGALFTYETYVIFCPVAGLCEPMMHT
jgi:hypothetical protein